MLGIFIVVLDDAVLSGIGEQLDNALFGFAGKLGDLRGGLGLAKAHFEHDLRDLVVGAGAIKNDILRVGLRQPFEAELVGKAVRDHFAEIK